MKLFGAVWGEGVITVVVIAIPWFVWYRPEFPFLCYINWDTFRG